MSNLSTTAGASHEDELAALPPILEVQNLSKHFKIYDKASHRLLEALLRRARHRRHQALDRISFQLGQGESLGVLGKNGAGKSTLLKLISGVLLPDSGTIRRHGRITGLLELGTGFDNRMSGRQNIGVNASLLGMSQQEVEEKMDAIIAFSELGHFIDAPVRTYSSGMVMRLGFAIAIHAEPACFVVDEALAVGDARFQQKCLKKIRDFRDAGGAILFVSHDINAVKQVCSRALVLSNGQIVFDGAPDAAAQSYYKLIAGTGEDGFVMEDETSSYGTLQTRVREVRMTDAAWRPVLRYAAGETMGIELEIEAEQDTAVSVGILIRDRFGQDVFGTNTALLNRQAQFAASGPSVCRFTLPANFAPGKYTVTVALHTEDSHVHDCHHWWDGAATFEISGFAVEPFSGICYVPVEFHGATQIVPSRVSAEQDRQEAAV
ncbi:ABC transporter ATP-binding protein [Paracidovorax citrulli]